MRMVTLAVAALALAACSGMVANDPGDQGGDAPSIVSAAVRGTEAGDGQPGGAQAAVTEQPRGTQNPDLRSPHLPPSSVVGLRALFLTLEHRVRLELAPPRSFGTDAAGREIERQLSRYEYRVNGAGAWAPLSVSCLLPDDDGVYRRDGHASGSECMGHQPLGMYAVLVPTAHGSVTYGVRAVGAMAGAEASATATVPQENTAPIGQIQLLRFRRASDGYLEVDFKIDDVTEATNRQGTPTGHTADLQVILYRTANCDDWFHGGAGIVIRSAAWTEIHGGRNIAFAVFPPDGDDATEIGARVQHKSDTLSACAGARRS